MKRSVCIVSMLVALAGFALAQAPSDKLVGPWTGGAVGLADLGPVQLTTLASGHAGTVELRGQSYSTGFEAPFTVGWLGTQQGWAAFNSTYQPRILSTGAPYAGTQHLGFARDPNVVDPNLVIGGQTPFFSPAYGNGERYDFSVRVKITGVNGGDYYVEPFDSGSGSVAARILFYRGGQIYVLNYNGTQYVYQQIGTWTANSYRELRVLQTLSNAGQIQYYYNGSLLYTDPNGIQGAATRMDGIALYRQNLQTADIGYFDAFSVSTVEVAAACCFFDGHCESLTPTNCTNAGGTYQGVGTICSGVNCPQGGACCMPSGLCVLRSQADCGTLGGDWQGALTTCTTGLCSVPTDCGPATLFSQPVVDTTGVWTFYTSDVDTSNTVMDNFSVSAPICELQWWGIDAFNDGTNWFECDDACPRFEINFYPSDAAGRPIITSPTCTYTLGAVAENTGISYSGFILKHYRVGFDPCCSLLTGWVSIRGINGGDDCWFLWGNATGGDLQAYQLQGTSLTPVADDLAFCLTSDYVPQFGACCVGTGCTAGVTEFACLNQCGEFYPDATCDPSPCQFGACCLMSGLCFQTTPPVCNATGGTFIGNNEPCVPGLCAPQPDCSSFTLFSQPIVDASGNWTFVTSDSATTNTAFDNFAAAAPICDLQWWGIDAYNDGTGWSECDQICPRFEIKFYPDDGTGKPAVNTPTNTYVLGAIAESTGLFYGELFELKHYDVGLSPCSELASGWVSIRGVDDGSDHCWFLWGNATGGDHRAYQLQDAVLTPLTDDLAMCLSGDYAGDLGACCVGPACTAGLTQFGCLNLCGEWHPGVGCNPNPCVPPTEGACCYPDGSCVMTLQANCTGIWHGDWTCTNNPCPSPQPGACCVAGGVCQQLTQTACAAASGHFFGPATACVACLCATCVGDANCDGSIDFDDINPFVEALSSGTACNLANCDCNCDGVVDFDDINAFVGLLGGSGCPKR